MADRAAEIERLAIGVGVREVRVGLSGKEAAQCGVAVAEAERQIIRNVQQGLAAEIIAARHVELDEGPRLAPGGRGAGFDIETGFPRALRENPVAARMRDVCRQRTEAGLARNGYHSVVRDWNRGAQHRDGGCEPRNKLEVLIERLRRQIAVYADGRRLVPVDRGRAVDDPVIEGFVDKPADPDRCVGAGDQERAGEAAADDRLAGDRLGAVTPGYPAAARHSLGELVNAALQQLLISAKIRQFISARRRKARQQGNRRGQPSQRRSPADIPLSGHCSPETSKVAVSTIKDTRPLAP